MTVWTVEHDCDDPYFSPYLEIIFSTEELAKEYVESKTTWERAQLTITEVEVKENI